MELAQPSTQGGALLGQKTHPASREIGPASSAVVAAIANPVSEFSLSLQNLHYCSCEVLNATSNSSVLHTNPSLQGYLSAAPPGTLSRGCKREW